MPEGHTIHRAARQQNRALKGRTISVSSPQGRFAADAAPITEALLVLDGDGPARNIAVMSNVAPAYAPAGQALIGGACPG